MVRVTVCLQLVLFVVILQQSDAVNEECSELQDDRARLQRDVEKIRALKWQEERARSCTVSGYSVVHCLHWVQLCLTDKTCEIKQNKALTIRAN